MSASPYVGRFAPSPTGPLHFGSLVAALASFIDARANDGCWLVRIEDIDPPREVEGAAYQILSALERWGLHWDGAVVYQSERVAVYRAVAEELLAAGHAFRCRCTRSTLAGARIYPGNCRAGSVDESEPHSIRAIAGHGTIASNDLLQGRLQWHMATDVGDFVIWRRDGLCAYQLAVTVDDDYQGVTHVVRGTDLLGSTPRQMHLRRLLGMPQPHFAHFAIAVNDRGEKLSKQTGAQPADEQSPGRTFFAALRFLRQSPPPDLAAAAVSEQLAWAVEHWDRRPLAGVQSLEIDSEFGVMTRGDNDAAPQQA